MKKRIAALLLALVMVLSLMPTAVFADTVDGMENPAIVEQEPVKDEEPAKDEETVKDEEPAKDEESVKDEEPTKDEEPVKDEEPTKDEGPAKDEAPVVETDEIIDEPVMLNDDGALQGSGTQEDPYLLSSGADLAKLSADVAAGNTFAGKYFKFTANITLPDNWTPIGSLKEGQTWSTTLKLATGYNAFSGIIDGDNHTLTVPAGSKTMLGAVTGSKLSNLNIYGEKIDGYGVVEYYCVGTYGAQTIEIDNVTLKSGTHTKYSGFIGGYASGSNKVIIRNCTVEEGVVIGDDGTYPEWAAEISGVFNYPYGPTGLQLNDMTGSFGGCFNGTIENCVSHAKVYGRNYVGGILGFKGQSMGDCIVRSCTFDGEVHATGKLAGGIVGGGYCGGTGWAAAPNTPAVTIESCSVSGSVSGSENVGGIFGGEEHLMQCWENGIGYIRGNNFTGTLDCAGEHVGGIIGYMKSLDRYNVIENNSYVASSAAKGIGAVDYVDTSCKTHETASGATYFDTSKATPGISGVTKTNHNRTDDPLGADADKLASVGKLTCTKLVISGTYKTEYKTGEELDMTGAVFTAKWTMGKTDTTVDVKDITFTGFDSSKRGQQTVTASYEGAKATFTVKVKKVYTDEEIANFGKATVYFSLSEDAAFKNGKDSAGTTLAGIETTVTYFDLADYGLEDFYCYDKQGNVVEKPTLLHLYIRMLEQYYLNGQKLVVGSDALTISGSAGSMFMVKFWGHNMNLMYYVNHAYPLQDDGKTGSTADQIVLKDGDVVEVAMYEDMNFYFDDAAGFIYFADAQGKAADHCSLTQGDELELVLYRVSDDMSGGSMTSIVPNTNVYVANQRTNDQAKWKKIGTTDKDGKITVKFDEIGDQFLYVAGAVNSSEIAVGAPTICAVSVTAKVHDVTLPNGVTGDKTATNGGNYTFKLTRESGYTYTIKATMGGQEVTVIDNGDGTYTVANVTGKLEITVTKTAINNNTGSTGNNVGPAKNPYQKDNKTDTKADSKDVKSGNTGDAGVTLYVGMGLVAVLAGAVVIGRKRKTN